MTSTKFLTGHEIIADILLEFPAAHEILAMHGIACAGCHINQYETLKDGISAHYGEDMFIQIMEDLNEALKESKTDEQKELKITEKAKTKILSLQEENNKQSFGLRVEANFAQGEIKYFLDFEELPEKGDKILQINEIKVFCDPDSYKILKNKSIDYKPLEEGFTFDNAE